jgi:diguanylate cyclase (GGDEF)-like protein/PAS domain S-box-containing protein
MKKSISAEGKKAPEEAKTKAFRPMDNIYRSLVEATSDSIYLVDKKCRYLYVNPKHCSRIGLQTEELVGRNYCDFHSPEETNVFAANVAEVFQSGDSFQRQYCSHRDGGEFLRTFSPVKTPPDKGKITAVSVISKNITEWTLAQHLYATLAEKSPIGIFIVQNKCFQWANQRFLDNTGYTALDIIRADSLFMVHPDDREHVRQSALAMMRGETVFPYEYRVVTKKGDTLWYMGTVTSIEYKHKMATLGCQMDISLQKRAEDALRQSEERSRTIIDSITDAYYEVDLRGNLLLFNEAFLKLFGYRQEEMLGISYKRYMDKKNIDIAFRAFSQIYKTGKPLTKLEWEIINKSGEVRQVELSVSLARDAQGRPKGFRGIMSDITARRKAEEAIHRQAFHDSLTNLANRILFNDRLNMAIKRAKRAQKMVAVIVIDLDNFKDVNDRWGHAAGDLLLKEVADRLADQVRDTDTVARQGGDEFSVALSSLNTVEDARQIAEKIVLSFYHPFHLDSIDAYVTASLGVALYPKHGDDFDSLMKKADKAMYEAKNLGRNRYCFYKEPVRE